MKKKHKRSKLKGQTAIELTIFGAMIVFITGAIVRQSMGVNQFQSQQLKAMRMAMLESHMYSEGLKGVGDSVRCGEQLIGGAIVSASYWKDGSRSRNSGSIMLIEDRLAVGSAKNAEIDRAPFVAQGSASHSRNLFMPHDPGECHNIAVFDLYVNGKHFPLLTGDFVQVTPPAEEVTEEITRVDKTKEMVTFKKYYVYEKIPNHAAFAGKWSSTNPEAFDLDRDGISDVDPSMWNLRGTGGDDAKYFSWQWHKVSAFSRAVRGGGSYDIDGDLKEEYVMSVGRNLEGEPVIYALDSQEGDMDFSHNAYDTQVLQYPTLGLLNEMEMYTEVRPGDGGDQGTYLLIQEGHLYANDGLHEQVVRSVNRKDQVDVISRPMRLARNTGRFCSVDFEFRRTEVDGFDNPVEVCCTTTECCFEKDTINKTCMAPNPDRSIKNFKLKEPAYDQRLFPIVYVRSRIKDGRGRKWITNINKDPTAGILATD